MWLTLLIFGVVWACLKIFAPLSDPWDSIATLVLNVLVVTYGGIILWEERRERKADQSA